MTELRHGFFPFVTGDQVSVKQGGAGAIVAKDSVEITQGGGQFIGAGKGISVSQGGSWIMGAGGGVTIDQGGSGMIAARDVRAERSILGVVFARKVSIEDSKLVIGSAKSFLLGVALGSVFTLFSSWARRKG